MAGGTIQPAHSILVRLELNCKLKAVKSDIDSLSVKTYLPDHDS